MIPEIVRYNSENLENGAILYPMLLLDLHTHGIAPTEGDIFLAPVGGGEGALFLRGNNHSKLS